MEPPNPVPIDMRKTKLKPEEAALIAGELVKPSWASRNEGIHERVSFEDTLWGFEMAGGKYYNTPLRVAYVRPGSRADHACIRMGDTVLKINGQDTSDLTLQEAHKLVLDAGIDLKIVVTSPEDTVNSHYLYQDPLNENAGPTAEQLKEMEMERVRKALERASHCRELPWPWVRKKWTIYRESNCYMVPSKYENKHRDQFPELPPENLDMFFPSEKIKRGKKNGNENTKHIKQNESNKKNEEKSKPGVEEVEEVEEIEEIEEAEEEEVLEEEIEIEGNGVALESSNERLNDKIPEIVEPKNLNDERSSLNHLEEEMENVSSLEDSKRKDSDQSSVSNYEIDNNNNHVVKSKNEPTNEAHEDTDLKSDDKIINEIMESANSLDDVDETVTKSDDDILDSVLKDNEDSKENER